MSDTESQKMADKSSLTNSLGGVTATPNTGNIPRITAPLANDRHLHSQTEAPAETSSHGISRRKIRIRPGLKRGTVTKPAGSESKDTNPEEASTPVAGIKKAPASGTKKPAKKRKKSKASRMGWVPDQHGAWAMVTVPIIIGIYLSGPVWQHILLFYTWLIGYFAFFATGLWLRSKRRERYWPPVRTYGIMTVAGLVLLISFSPAILEWSPVFAVLIVLAAWQSITHQERSLLARTSTVIAAGLMTPVAYDMGTNYARSFRFLNWLHSANPTTNFPGVSPAGGASGWTWVWIVTFCLTAYYWGSIPYVKTLIRARESVAYVAVSALSHAAITAVVGYFAYHSMLTWFHFGVWVVLTIRAIMMPTAARAWGVHWRPKIIGWGEVVASIFVVVSLLFV